jgi:hypothetical protein
MAKTDPPPDDDDEATRCFVKDRLDAAFFLIGEFLEFDLVHREVLSREYPALAPRMNLEAAYENKRQIEMCIDVLKIDPGLLMLAPDSREILGWLLIKLAEVHGAAINPSGAAVALLDTLKTRTARAQRSNDAAEREEMLIRALRKSEYYNAPGGWRAVKPRAKLIKALMKALPPPRGLGYVSISTKLKELEKDPDI